MKKIILIAFVLLSVFAFTVSAQEVSTTETNGAPTVGEPSTENSVGETAQTKMQIVSVDKFESDGFWKVSISSDEGVATGRLFEGGPAAKDAPAEERYAGENPQIADTHVYGARIDFFRRGNNSFYVMAQKPIPIEGITNLVSVWVTGRNYNHTLKLIISDFFNQQFEITVGQLNFQGWKQLKVAIPPQDISGIAQRNFHYNNHMGIKIVGFKIECDPMEAYGSYYIYFDDLRAETDLFAEDARDADDMVDGW